MARFSIGPGRPSAARNTFSRAFLTDFLADWEQHGPAAIKTVRVRDPSTYLRVAASILPKEMTIDAMTTGLSADERSEMIAAIKQHLLTIREERPMLIEATVNEPEPKRNGSGEDRAIARGAGNGSQSGSAQ
jgi:hypothetical protein